MLIESSKLFFTRSDYINILSSQNLETAIGYLSEKFLASEIGKLAGIHGISVIDVYNALDKGYRGILQSLFSQARDEERSIADKILWLLSSLDLYLSLNALTTGVKPPLMASPLPLLIPEIPDPMNIYILREILPAELHGLVKEYINKRSTQLQQVIRALDSLAMKVDKLKYYELSVLVNLLHDMQLLKACILYPEVRQLQPKVLSLNPANFYENCGKSIREVSIMLSKDRPFAVVFSEAINDSLKFSSGIEALDLGIYTGLHYLASLILQKTSIEKTCRLMLKLLGQYVFLKLVFTVVSSGLYRQEASVFISKWVT